MWRFSRSCCLVTLLKAHSGWDWKWRRLGPSAPPGYSGLNVTSYSLNFHPWVHQNSVLMGRHKHCEWGNKKWQVCKWCIPSPLACVLHGPVEPHMQNTSSQIKFLRTSRWQRQSIKPTVESLWLHGSYAHESGPARGMGIGVPKKGGAAGQTVHETFL